VPPDGKAVGQAGGCQPGTHGHRTDQLPRLGAFRDARRPLTRQQRACLGKWYELRKRGIVHSKDKSSFNRYIKRYFGKNNLADLSDGETNKLYNMLEGWLQGLHAIEAVHRQNQFLSQAFARNMVLTETGGIGFIDFEDNPATVLSLQQCQSRDWLCYLQSTADILLRSGLLDQAAEHCKACLKRQNPAIIRTLRRSVRPILWMRRIQSERWGCDTLRLAALADLFYRMGEI